MDLTSKEKIRDIKSVINEFYHNEKCEGRLTECARKSWLLFQEYCDDILQDLERLEVLEIENEQLKDSIQIKQKQVNECIDTLTQENQELKEFQVLTKQGLWNLKSENEKLKKAFKILTQRIIIKTHKNFLFGGRHLDIANTTMKLTDDEYDLLKEVLGE